MKLYLRVLYILLLFRLLVREGGEEMRLMMLRLLVNTVVVAELSTRKSCIVGGLRVYLMRRRYWSSVSGIFYHFGLRMRITLFVHFVLRVLMILQRDHRLDVIITLEALNTGNHLTTCL
jgi:hypothetical protein